MSIVLQDACSYPGLVITERADYTCSHGVTPGQIQVLTRVPPSAAYPMGTFIFGDGQRALSLRDCKLERSEGSQGEDIMYTVTLLDRRWRWRTGHIDGHYNQLDTRGNLKPRFARRPKELAILCLKAMGETRWEIDLPDGVGQDQLDPTNENPAPGEITPPTSSNPEVIWDNENPAQALARLCDLFGRRFVWCPVRDMVIIARPGDGGTLPANDFLDSVTENIRTPERPRGIGVIGAVNEYQGNWKLEAVGIEWDGRIVNIELLTYRPDRKPQKGKYKVTLTAGGDGTYSFNGSEIGPVLLESGFTNSSPTGLISDTAAHINTSNGLKGVATASSDGLNLIIETVKIGEPLDLNWQFSGPAGSKMEYVTVDPPYSSAWEGEIAGSFAGVQATDRLSYDKAKELAMRSVWRMYRLANEDVESGWELDREPSKIFVPGYGEVPSRTYLQLMPTMVEQLRPQPPNPDIINPGAFGPVEIEYYDGYSRSRVAAAYGSVCNLVHGRWSYKDAMLNSPAGSRVPLEPQIDSANWLATFPQPVFYVVRHPGNVPSQQCATQRGARLVLETAVQVRDTKTMQLVRYRRWADFDPRTPPDVLEQTLVDLTKYQIPAAQPVSLQLPPLNENVGIHGATEVPEGIEWHQHDDVAYGEIGVYTLNETKETYDFVSSAKPFDDVSQQRADYYLIGHILEHQLTGGVSAGYHGIQPIPMDGAIMQTSYSVGGFAMTRASRNCEHGIFTLPYPLRRREEAIAADAERARLNHSTSPHNLLAEFQRLGTNFQIRKYLGW